MSTEIAAEADEEPGTAVTVSHGPARVSAAMALFAALLALFTSATFFLGLLVGVFGFVGLAVGLFGFGSRRLAGLSTALVFAGVVASGVSGAPETLVVLGALASIAAFDLTQNAFSVGSQLSAETETWRGEFVHAAATAGIGAVTVIVSFAIFALAGGQVAAPALVFLFLGVVLLLWAIRA